MALGVHERFDSFGGIFDNVQDVTEINDISLALGLVCEMDWIPTVGVVAERLQSAHIASLAAAVIEERCSVFKQSVFEQRLHGLGQVVARQGRFMPVDRRSSGRSTELGARG